MNIIWIALITGLTTGGISCLAVQGGLLASALSHPSTSSGPYGKTKIVGMFLLAKIVAYTILGFGLGAVGASLSITPRVQGWMQIFAGLYMLATAANLLNLHPIFRHVVIQPPRFAYKFMRRTSKSGELFAPAMLGALTVLIPCGVTQGMMVFATSSANPILGASIMFAFTLGTTPVFAILGLSASKLMEKKAFVYISAALILFLGVLSINTGQVLRGSAHTAQNYWRVLTTDPGEVAAAQTTASLNSEGQQEVIVEVTGSGYTTSANTLKAGVPVKLKLVSKNAIGCSRAFTIPELGISKILPVNGEEEIEFTPSREGRLAFSCSMGMYNGEFNIN